MYPMYRYNMEPYSQAFPFSKDQTPYPYHHYPSWGPVPSHMRIDPSKHSSDVGPWLYNTSPGHSIPTDHHNCCNHSYPPGLYTMRPPYPQVLPPPQLYCPGAYPLYPSTSPAYCFSPPYYPPDQACYDNDKAKEHCCGCRNHICNRKDGTNGVKIDEEEPKNNGPSGLFQSSDYPYPVVWIPPGYLKGNDKTQDSESRAGLTKGWIPLGLNGLHDMKSGGAEKKHQNGEERKMQYPWPIFCLPGYEGNEDNIKDLKESNVDSKSAEELPPQFKAVPLKLLENGNHAEKPEVATDESGSRAHQEQMAEREVKTKIIPVMQMEEPSEIEKVLGRKKNTPEKENTEVKKASGRGTKAKLIPVLQMEEPTEKQKCKVLEMKKNTPEKENAEVKKGSDNKSLPSKKSNLPPVCLRVDPLPRKKNSNGTSRSPSPPRHKAEGTLQKNKEVEIAKEEKEKAPKKEIKVMDIGESKKQEAVPAVSPEVTEGQPIAETVREDEDRKKTGGKDLEAAVEKEEPKVEKEGNVAALESGEGEMKERRKLSESEAAVIIQSAYRGFEARRWQPLEKLRRIARIRDQVAGVKGQIDGLEASSKQQDAKQKVIISETIMNLLLQLDTVQGLHASVREIRKAVAKDLTCLQEKLDSLGSHATGEHEPVKNEGDSTGSALVQNSSTAAKLADEGEYVRPASEDGEAVQPSFKVESVPGLNTADVAFGESELVETLEKSANPSPSLINVGMISGDEERGGEPRVEEESFVCEVIEKPDPSDDGISKQLSSEYEAVTALGEVPVFDEQEIPNPQEIPVFDEQDLPNSQEATHGECPVLQEKPSDLGAVLDINVDPGSKRHSEASKIEEEPNQEEVVIKPEEECLLAKPEDLPTDVISESNVDVIQQTLVEKLPNSSSAELHKPVEEAMLVDSHQLEFKSNAEELVEVSAEEVKSDSNTGTPEMKQEPLVVSPVVEEKNRANDTLVLEETSNPNSSEVSCVDAVEDNKDAILAQEKQEAPEMLRVGRVWVLDSANDDEMNSQSDDSASETGELDSRASLESTNNEVSDLASGGGGYTGVLEFTSDEGMNSQSEDGDSGATKFIEAGAPLDSTDSEFSSVAPGGDGFTVNEANTTELEVGVAYEPLQESAHEVGPVVELNSEEKKLMEENAKLKEMLEKLLEAGKQQLGTISDLNVRVRDLEKKLSQKKKVRVKRNRAARGTPCLQRAVKSYAGNSVSPAA